MALLWPLVAACVLAQAGGGAAQAVQASIVFNGWLYELSSDALTWAAANSVCQARGAQLASVHSEAENDAIFNMLPILTRGGTRWLGGQRVRTLPASQVKREEGKKEEWRKRI